MENVNWKRNEDEKISVIGSAKAFQHDENNKSPLTSRAAVMQVNSVWKYELWFMNKRGCFFMT